MRTVLLVVGIWMGASVFTAVVFAVGAAMGHRRAVDAFREAAIQKHDRLPVDSP